MMRGRGSDHEQDFRWAKALEIGLDQMNAIKDDAVFFPARVGRAREPSQRFEYVIVAGSDSFHARATSVSRQACSAAPLPTHEGFVPGRTVPSPRRVNQRYRSYRGSARSVQPAKAAT